MVVGLSSQETDAAAVGDVVEGVLEVGDVLRVDVARVVPGIGEEFVGGGEVGVAQNLGEGDGVAVRVQAREELCDLGVVRREATAEVEGFGVEVRRRVEVVP